jgi:hypothetical protein
MSNIYKELEYLVEQADELGMNYIESIVRKELERNKKLGSFTMAMGTWFFQDKKGNILHNFELKELEEFLGDWDDMFKYSGEPINLKKSGGFIIKITDW